MVGPALPESRGSLELLIGFFSRAGRVVCMPRVPDGRAGGVAVLRLLGRGGCVGKQPSTMPNVVGGWFCSLLGTLGGPLGRETLSLGLK